MGAESDSRKNVVERSNLQIEALHHDQEFLICRAVEITGINFKVK